MRYKKNVTRKIKTLTNARKKRIHKTIRYNCGKKYTTKNRPNCRRYYFKKV